MISAMARCHAGPLGPWARSDPAAASRRAISAGSEAGISGTRWGRTASRSPIDSTIGRFASTPSGKLESISTTRSTEGRALNREPCANNSSRLSAIEIAKEALCSFCWSSSCSKSTLSSPRPASAAGCGRTTIRASPAPGIASTPTSPPKAFGGEPTTAPASFARRPEPASAAEASGCRPDRSSPVEASGQRASRAESRRRR